MASSSAGPTAAAAGPGASGPADPRTASGTNISNSGSGSDTKSLPGRGNPQRQLTLPAHALSWQAVVDELTTDGMEGLGHAEAEDRVKTIGKNEVEEDSGVNVFEILGGQVANAMTLVGVALEICCSHSSHRTPSH
jgi:hypothetical protein